VKKNIPVTSGPAAAQNKTASAPAAKSPQEQDAVVRNQHRPAIGRSALCLPFSKRCANDEICLYNYVYKHFYSNFPIQC